MTIRRETTGVIHIEGVARVEDAELLVAALQGHADPEVDLAACTGLHGAVLQALLVFRPRISGLTPGAALDWLIPILEPTPPPSVKT